MSHNVSERKLMSLEATARADAAFGWWRAGPKDKWSRVDCPRGLLARGGRVVGVCSSRDCQRRVRFDPQWWIDHGLGDLRMDKVQAAYTCSRIPCGLAWQSELYPNGRPLMSYADDQGAKVTVRCGGCTATKVRTARDFVDSLLQAGRVSPNLPAWNLDGAVRGPCPACGQVAWRVTLAIPGQIIARPPGS